MIPTPEVGDFNTPFLALDKSSRQNVNIKVLEITDILNQMDLIDI